MKEFVTALGFARRELRGGLSGLRVFLACLVLSAAAIAGVGSISEAVRAGLRADGRVLIGGDAQLRLAQTPASAAAVAHFRASGRLSRSVEMRAMVRWRDARAMAEVKAVDEAYPLFGALTLTPNQSLDAALAPRDGRHGLVVEAALLARLGAELGETVAIGDAEFVITGAVEREPDRMGGGFVFGPRAMMSRAAIEATGLIRPGSRINYFYRLGLAPTNALRPWLGDLRARFPDAAWRVRQASDAAPGVRRFVERLELYLTLVGLTALLVGGVGAANAIRGYLERRVATIATLKSLGATRRTIFYTYLAQIVVLAVAGLVPGLAIGALAPLPAGWLLAAFLPVEIDFAIHFEALARAGLFGLLTALAFALWPLGRACSIPAARLFRDLVAPAGGRPNRREIAALVAVVGLLIALVVYTALDRWFAIWFVGGVLAALVAFRLAASGVAGAAQRLGTIDRVRRTAWLRLALANLHRPGAPLTSMMLSLGLGLSVFVAVATIEGNLQREVSETLPDVAPSFYFIDIQPDQIDAFEARADRVAGTERLDRVAMARGRIVALDGRPVSEVAIDPHVRWIVAGDRGLTYAATPPPGSRIVAGAWWPADYAGPPLVSFDAEGAAGMGLAVGDTITVNLLGREITATIANLRHINWRGLAMNFVIVFSPGAIDRAPHTFIATVRAAPEAEAPLVRAITDAFANITAIRVKDALEQVDALLGYIGAAMRATGAFTLLIGILVLGGAVAASHRQRVYDAAVLKVLGATRADVVRTMIVEFALLGMVAAAIAALVGSVAGWGVIAGMMEMTWRLDSVAVLATVGFGTLITALFGLVAIWVALGQRAAPLLRSA